MSGFRPRSRPRKATRSRFRKRPYLTRPVPALVAALGDRLLHVRASAVQALGEFRDERAAAALRDALKDPSPVVRKLEREAIGKLEREE